MAAEIQFNVDQAIAKLGELVSKHGPQAVDLAAQVVQVQAVGNLGIGVLTSAASIAGFIGVARHIQSTKARYGERYDITDTSPVIVAGGGTISAIAGLVALTYLLDVWNWVALSNPKLALAHQVLTRVTGL